MRSSGDHGAGDAERPHVPHAHPPRPYDPRVAGRPRGRPADAGREDFTGPQASSELPGYEFEAPYRRRDTGEFRQVRDTDGFGRARDTGGFSRVRKTDDFDALPDVDPRARGAIRDSGGFRPPRESGGFPAARDPRAPRALPPTSGRDAGRDSGGFGGVRDSGGFDAVRNSGGFGAVRGSGGFGAVRDSGGFDAVRDSGGFGAVRDPGEGRAIRDSGGLRAPRHSGAFPATRHPRRPGRSPVLADLTPPVTRAAWAAHGTPAAFGAVRNSGGFDAVRGSGGFDAARRSGGIRPPRDSGGFPAARDPRAPRALPPTGGPDAVRDSGGFGAARNSGGFDAVRDSGGFRAVRNSGGLGENPYSDGSDSVRDSGGYGAARRSGGFDAVPNSGGFDPVRDSGGFGAARNSGGFRAGRRDSGGFGAVRNSGGMDRLRDSGGFRAPREPGGFDAVRDSGGFDEARDTGQRRPLTLRYTPTVASSGPLGPVPPPPEFAEPRRRSGAGDAAAGTAQPQGPRGCPAERLAPPRERRPAIGSREPREALEAPYEQRARSASHGRPGPRHGAGRRDRDGLDGQHDLGILRRLRYPADQLTEQGFAARLGRDFAAAMRSRNWVSGLAVPIVAAIAVGIAVVVVAGANNGSGPAPSSLDAGYPPARAATADFTGTPALAGRGMQASLGQVATSGGTIVAVGGQSGARIPRARFYVSADNGQTWQLGTVQGDPPPGQAATLVAGGARGWVAVGPTAVWTSQNARDWDSHSQLPQLAGDKITTLTATGSGFLAAGTNVPGGNAAKASPVVWLSANGTAWQRLGVTQLGLAAGNGRVLGITGAAANGGAIVMYGTVAGAATASGVWRSANGGTTWTAVTVPAGGGASATIAGLAPLRGGFVAVRSAPDGGATGAAVYTSANGTAWQQSAALRTADGSPLTLGPVSGGPGGAVVTGQAHGLDIAFLSPDGTTWTGTDPAGTATAEQVSGVALTAAGQAVFSGTSTATAAEQQPVLTLIGAQGAARQVNIAAIPGAVTAELAVNAIAASGTTQVAAGSADGLPALWVSTDGGSTWTRAAGAAQAVLGRPGVEQLTGVAHGAAGWLAVGGGATAAQGPVVVGSTDGRTWTALDGVAAFAGQGQVVTAAAADPAGYVIAGHQLMGGRTVAAVWDAPGLTGWQRAAIALPATGDSQLNAVTATGKGFVAVGSAGTRAAAWLSPTGRTWSLVTVPQPAGAASAQLDFVAANGTTVAATGTEVTAAGQRVPFAAVSADGGTTWTLDELPAPPAARGTATGVTALAAAGSGFTATGTYGTPGSQDVVIWTLAARAAAGTAWTAASPDGMGLAGPGTHAITALAGAGSTLTGVGYVATPAAEEPTIWQSPVRN